MRVLSLLSLAFAGLLHAAPAPLPKRDQGPEYSPVQMSGWLSEQRLPGKPSVIACQADWQAVAKALGIENPPSVNFETHFLFIHVSHGYGEQRCEVDSNGDLSAVGGQQEEGEHRLAKVRLLVAARSGRAGPRYLIKSFPRSAVKTVNGSPLPKR